MSISPHEFCGDAFDLDQYLAAQEKTKQVVLNFSKKVIPGMKESSALTLLEQMLDESRLEKRWHPTKFRMGSNTTKNFRDESQDYILKEDDIFFADIGPVYNNHEGDYGETFTVGNGIRLKEIAAASKAIFLETQKTWKEKKLTGRSLYEYADQEAKKYKLKLNSNMYGHRLGDFPHAVHTRAKLGDLPFHPSPILWVLEIHVIDESLGVGAFYEDVLT
ncbi:MAG: M24 family metallopeptidase [Bdellovibrionales bacterium]|nr:M24 family metallopeptidase [Bdellovibrionales bacterium]